MISREEIINKMTNDLIDNDHVYALWLEGADCLGRVDQYSDIDFWLDVEDEYIEEVMDRVEKILSELGNFDMNIKMRHPMRPVITQKMFHFKESSKYLLIDVCLQQHSRGYIFNADNPDERPKVLFDRANIVSFRPANQENLRKEILDSLDRIKKIFKQNVRIENKIKRGQFLEAWAYYHKWLLKPLIELLRIKHCPYKKDYYCKHIYYDLPKDIVHKLEDLHRVNTVDEIEDKMEQALKWGDSLLND